MQDDVIDEIQETEASETPAEEVEEVAEGETPDVAEETAETSDEVIVSIGDEVPRQEEEFDGKPAPDWVKELRKEHKRLLRENRELRESKKVEDSPEPVIGKEPELEDFDYDTEKFKKAYQDWVKSAQEVEAAKRQKAEAESKAKERWAATVDSYGKAKAKLQAKVPNFDDAEAAVKDAFSIVQQNVLLDAVESPDSAALMVAALGANPKKLKELAAIDNAVKFTAAIAKLEDKLKVTPKKAVPPPERVLRGSAPSGTFSQANLDKLKEKARDTGNYDEYFAAKRKIKG